MCSKDSEFGDASLWEEEEEAGARYEGKSETSGKMGGYNLGPGAKRDCRET